MINHNTAQKFPSLFQSKAPDLLSGSLNGSKYE
jgi:hypothetical protein